MGDPAGVLICDQTGFRKQRTKAVVGQRQYSGTAGRIENCQLRVFLAYASSKRRTLLDRALYLPREWVADTVRAFEPTNTSVEELVRVAGLRGGQGSGGPGSVRGPEVDRLVSPHHARRTRHTYPEVTRRQANEAQ